MKSSSKASVANIKRPDDLPDFKRPPLIEVALGVQFSELRDYRTYHAGLLWSSKFRDKFPICTERPPLSATFETFGIEKSTPPQVQLVTVPGPSVPRLWFINSEETELIQFQANRFLHNWRRVPENETYPRYEPIREHFFKELDKVQSFLTEEEVGTIEPNQCEITYVNHIVLGDSTDPRTQLHRIFVFWNELDTSTQVGGKQMPTFEDGRFGVRFAITDPNSGEPRGRLHIEAETAIESGGRPVIRLNLTARGSPRSPSFPDVAEFLDLGRDAIVRNFTTITTEEMHKYWERTK